MISRIGSSSGSATPTANSPPQEQSTTGRSQTSPGRSADLSNRPVPADRGGRHAPRSALSKGKGKAPVTSAPEGSSPAALPAGVGRPEEPVTRVRERVAELMKLGTQRKRLQPAAPAARQRGQAVEPAGPSEADIARLCGTVGTLEIKAEEQAREVQRAEAELLKQETKWTTAQLALEQPGTPAATVEPVAAAREGPARREQAGQAQPEHLGVPAVPPQASPLQKAREQVSEARRQLNDADGRLKVAVETLQQKKQAARASLDECTRTVGFLNAPGALLSAMESKIKVDSHVLAPLGLPPPRGEGTKESLRREFQTYQDKLTEPLPDGRRKFKGSVGPGLPKLMAFDALVRTSLSRPVESISWTACKVYRKAHPGSHNHRLEETGDMARLGLDKLSAGWGFITHDEVAQARGRQKVGKPERQSGVSAADARPMRELRRKDAGGLSEHARMLQELLQDNRAELEESLGLALEAGIMGLADQLKGFLGRLAEAQQLVDQLAKPNATVAAGIKEVEQAREALRQAEVKVKEIESQRPDPSRADTTPTLRPAAIPQIPSAPPGPGLARDSQTRTARQQGRIQGLEAARDSARKVRDKASAERRRTDDDLQKARDRLAAAQAEHGQAREVAQQELAQQRVERGEQGTRLKELDAQIGQARADLLTDPALLGLIDPWALERVIKVHVDPDDEAVRQRALGQTGLNGRYDSLEHMAQAVVDVHEAAKSRFPHLFAARTLQEFEQAAQKHSECYDAKRNALVNISHEHGDRVGQGYDDQPDRTGRLSQLTGSEYGLAWREDRVVVSHLHPSVPRRTLTTLAQAPAGGSQG